MYVSDVSGHCTSCYQVSGYPHLGGVIIRRDSLMAILHISPIVLMVLYVLVTGQRDILEKSNLYDVLYLITCVYTDMILE